MSKWVVILHDAVDASPAGRARLREQFIKQLGLSPEAASRIFDALPVVIRRDLAQAKAESFLAILERAGAVAEMIEYNGQLRLPDMGSDMLESESETLPTPKCEQSESESLQLRPVQEVSESIHALEDMLDEVLGQDDSLVLQPELPEGTKQAPIRGSLFEIEASEELSEPVPRGANLLLDTPIEEESGPMVAAVTETIPAESEISQEMSPEHVPIYAGAFAGNTADISPTHLVEPSPVSVAAEVVPALPFWRKPKILALGGVSAVSLAALAVIGMPLLFRTTAEIEIKIDINSLLQEQRDILRSSPEVTEQPQWEKKVWTAETTAGGVRANLVLLEVGGRVVQAGLELSTEKPPKRTDEEIVNGVKPPVWLRRFLAKGISPFVVLLSDTENPARPFTLQGVGRGFVSDELGSERIVAPVEISGSWNAESNCWTGAWKISKNMDGSELARGPYVERLQKNEFRLNLSQQFLAKPE